MPKFIHSTSGCLLAFLILCLCSGCYGTYMGLDMDLTGSDKLAFDQNLVADEYLPVRVALNDPSFRSATRAYGAFDTSRPQNEIDSLWNHAIFHLYAFRRDGIGSFAESVDSKQYSCLLDNEEARMGDMSSLLLAFNDKNKYGHPIYWNDAIPQVPYMFFGYYIDDARITDQHRTDDSITVSLSIDGSQDLLCGHARLTAKQEELIDNSAVPSYMRTYNYSTYTARRNLFPVLDLKHQLSRLRFIIFPNDERCENITIDSIKVESYRQVHMVVAHRDTSRVGSRSYGPKSLIAIHNLVDGSNRLLYESDGEILPFRLTWDPSYSSLAVYSRPSLVCGESLMLPPDSVYVLHTYTTQFHTETGIYAHHEYEDELRLSGGQSFLPGGYYNIRISVGGMQQILVQASLVQWQTGEDINQTITHE